MNEKDFNVADSQKALMELLVSRTLRKHGVQKGKHDLSEKEKANLKETVKYLQEQSNKLMQSENSITEKDVNPRTNIYEGDK
ncbi:hypothetical protein ACFVHQ_06125 [Actinomycetes bacterium NPDC127524]|uniref:hypothetical protein n=1 Tax=Bacillus sp. MUM 13 TaxID=1678001 RepID=UPI0008F5EAE2|nr:hypothetical protein [Bacillus sp. MUM 13]OIK11109.1 hypothetical protein BIV59_13145 [Bacillus sp. MUM 13]